MNLRTGSLTLAAILLMGCPSTTNGSGGACNGKAKVTPSAAPSAAPAPALHASCPIRVAPQAGDSRARIQAAIDLATSSDCGDVLLEAGAYEISGPIQLRSGVRLSGQRFKRTFSVLRPTPDFSGKALLVTKFAPETAERKQTEYYIENLRLDAIQKCPTRKRCAEPKVEVGIWLENTSYPTIRDAEFSRFPATGAAIRGGGVLYLKLMDCRFLSNMGWSVDLAIEYVPKKPGTNKPHTYYAVSVGIIERNYFATRRGIRLTPSYSVTIRDNQFEGGLSMIHAYEHQSSVLNIENNYFELSKVPEDIPERGSIAIRGTGRVVGNMVNGPPKGKLPSYPGPGIEVLGGASVTIADNVIRCFDPGVKVRGARDRQSVRDGGNLIAPKDHVRVPWDVPEQMLAPVEEEPPPPIPELPDKPPFEAD